MNARIRRILFCSCLLGVTLLAACAGGSASGNTSAQVSTPAMHWSTAPRHSAGLAPDPLAHQAAHVAGHVGVWAIASTVAFHALLANAGKLALNSPWMLVPLVGAILVLPAFFGGSGHAHDEAH
jgi:hypothetical protein